MAHFKEIAAKAPLQFAAKDTAASDSGTKSQDGEVSKRLTRTKLFFTQRRSVRIVL